ncbi:MAG: DUF5013 domain-containing protein [Pedobacter sp.]
MNKILKPILILFCSAAFIACEKDRVFPAETTETGALPAVNYEIVATDDPFTFSFKNNSTAFKSIEWRFGDDSLSTETSPTHLFLRDGKYEVVMTATSETGATARKLVVLEIDANKFAKVFAASNGTANTVKFKINTTVPLQSIKWDFGDATTGDQLEPAKTYGVDQLFISKATFTTKKGSQATISKLISADGSVEEVTSKYIKNTGPKFVASERVGSRWGVVADWRVNQAVRQREGGMGGWDEWEGNSMSMEKWGGEPEILNGKIEQTSLAPLPVNKYFYELKFHDFSVKDKLYNVISKANSLPDIGNVETDANVLGRLKFNGNAPLVSYTAFRVTEVRNVTFGFVATFQQADQNFKLTHIKLYQLEK